MGLPDKEDLLGALRAYRREMSDLRLNTLLRVAGLEKDFTSPADS
jgi:hypothetical protein